MPEKKKNHTQRRIKRMIAGGVLVLIAFALIIAAWPTIRQASWQWQLNQAQARWEQNKPDHYHYHEMMCAMRCFHTFVTIKDGEIIAAFSRRDWLIASEIGDEPPELPIQTIYTEPYQEIDNFRIDVMFQAIGENLKNGWPIYVEYDPVMGYPNLIERDCEVTLVNPITGLCHHYNFKTSILEFEILSEE
jgi:hypothetical protein